MTAIVLDFAWSKPSVSQLQALNVVAVGMYVSHDTSKNANLTVVQHYAAAGIKSFLFFEDTADRARFGYSAGQADAQFSYQLAKSYGKPGWAPIVPSMDFDVPDYAPGNSDPMAKLGPVGQYCKAWQDVGRSLGHTDDAAYGDYYVIKRLAAAGLCTFGVQTAAWSGGQIDLADIVLYQNATMVFGGSADIEIIESAELLKRLAWIPGEANPQPIGPSMDNLPGIWRSLDSLTTTKTPTGWTVAGPVSDTRGGGLWAVDGDDARPANWGTPYQVSGNVVTG